MILGVEQRKENLYGLLIATDVAIAECQEWAGQDIPRNKFIDYLKLNDILILTSPTEFKEQIKKFSLERKAKEDNKTIKRKITQERREALRKHAEKMREIVN